MNLTEFWRLVERVKEQSPANVTTRTEILIDLLAEHRAADILTFSSIFDTLHWHAYREDLYNASTIFKTSISDDAFAYFRGWLIAQGEQVYKNALRDPDTLATVVDDTVDDGESECEEMLYVAADAYERVTGDELPPSTVYPLPPEEYDWEEREAGNTYKRSRSGSLYWEDADLSRIFPRLWERFGAEAGDGQ